MIINCAGLQADRIAEMVGIDIYKAGYELEYYKGDYFKVKGEVPVKNLIYPVPLEEGKGFGITYNARFVWQCKIGPYNFGCSSKRQKKYIKLYFESGKELCCTPDHDVLKLLIKWKFVDRKKDRLVATRMGKKFPNFT